MKFEKYLKLIRNHELNFVLDKSNLDQEMTLIDFGSGNGAVLDRFESKGFTNIVGVDVFDTNYRGSNIGEKKIVYYDGSVSNLPFTSADVIFSSNVLEHLEYPLEYIKVFNSKLNEMGVQIHVMPTHFWKFYNSLFYYPKVIEFILKKVFGRSSKKKSGPDYKAKQKIGNKKESRLFIGRHGARGTTFSEFVLFNPKSWCELLDSQGIQYEDYRIPLVYSGHNILGALFPFSLRQKLVGIFGYSSHLYIIKKY